jgi:hypothetical protein
MCRHTNPIVIATQIARLRTFLRDKISNGKVFKPVDTLKIARLYHHLVWAPHHLARQAPPPISCLGTTLIVHNGSVRSLWHMRVPPYHIHWSSTIHYAQGSTMANPQHHWSSCYASSPWNSCNLVLHPTPMWTCLHPHSCLQIHSIWLHSLLASDTVLENHLYSLFPNTWP